MSQYLLPDSSETAGPIFKVFFVCFICVLFIISFSLLFRYATGFSHVLTEAINGGTVADVTLYSSVWTREYL